MTELNPTVAAWFQGRRGIRPETVKAFGIHTEGRQIVIPYPEGMTKFRWSSDPENPFGLEKAGRAFTWKDADGKSGQAGQVPFLPPDFEPRERMIVLEGETDTMAAWQALPDELRDKVGIVGLSGVGSWASAITDRGLLEPYFGQAKRVFFPLDNDDPYANPDGAASVERGWKAVRSDLGRKARRVRLPQGASDVAEFFMAYDWAAFEVLLRKAAQARRFYPRLDLTQPAPPVDWLIEDMIVGSEVTALLGDGGSGKSWLTMAMALAVAGIDDKYIGLPVKRHGPVLYVDEELSRDLVLQRINALGFDKDVHLPNLEYLWYAGVDLAREPEKLYEEALEIEPALIVIDSLSRVALGMEENSNTEMTQLIRGSLVPLARDTGAALVFVHHTSKDNPTGARGASQIRNAADQAISVVPSASGGVTYEGHMNIFPSKPRREGAHIEARRVGSMKDDGWVRIEPPEDVM